MSRRMRRNDRLVWIPLAVMALLGIAFSALAQNGPCNCGDGKPCLANQMYFGYYPTVWRQWPGNCAMPQMARPTPGGQKIPPIEPPPPKQEFETKSFGPETTTDIAPGAVPGTPRPEFAPNNAQQNGALQESAPQKNLQPGGAQPPAPINPPLTLPSSDSQKLNQLLPPTSPQAFAPYGDPNRLPAGQFLPAYSQAQKDQPLPTPAQPVQTTETSWPSMHADYIPERTTNYQLLATLPTPIAAAAPPVRPSNSAPPVDLAFSCGALDAPRPFAPSENQLRPDSLPEQHGPQSNPEPKSLASKISEPAHLEPSSANTQVLNPNFSNSSATQPWAPPVAAPHSCDTAQPLNMAVPRSNSPASLSGFTPFASGMAPAASIGDMGARRNIAPAVTTPVRRIAAEEQNLPPAGMSEPIIVSDEGCSKLAGINPLTIDETLSSAAEPKLTRLPGDNPLSKSQVQVSDAPESLEASAFEHHALGTAAGAGLDPRSASPNDVRQTSYLMHQPSGEANGLSAVDPLALSRTLSAPPAATETLRPLPPIAPIAGSPISTFPIAQASLGNGQIPGGSANFGAAATNMTARGPMASGPVALNNPAGMAQQPLPRSPQVQPSDYLQPAMPMAIQPTHRIPAAVPARPSTEQASSAGNPLRTAAASSGQNMLIKIPSGIDSPVDEAADAQRNPLR